MVIRAVPLAYVPIPMDPMPPGFSPDATEGSSQEGALRPRVESNREHPLSVQAVIVCTLRTPIGTVCTVNKQ